MTGLVSEGETEEDREDESDVCLEWPSENNRSLILSPMSCEGDGRIVSAEVPGWKSTGADKAGEAMIWSPSRGDGEPRSSSDKETEECEFELEGSTTESRASTRE